jgi:hypothetical protein
MFEAFWFPRVSSASPPIITADTMQENRVELFECRNRLVLQGGCRVSIGDVDLSLHIDFVVVEP